MTTAEKLVILADRTTRIEGDSSLSSSLNILYAARCIIEGTRPGHFAAETVLDVQRAFNILAPNPEISGRRIIEVMEMLASLRDIFANSDLEVFPGWLAPWDIKKIETLLGNRPADHHKTLQNIFRRRVTAEMEGV